MGVSERSERAAMLEDAFAPAPAPQAATPVCNEVTSSANVVCVCVSTQHQLADSGNIPISHLVMCCKPGGTWALLGHVRAGRLCCKTLQASNAL